MHDNNSFLCLEPASLETLMAIDANAGEITDTITEEYFKKHPEHLGMHEARIRKLCHEDMGHHLDYLKNSLRIGIPGLFSEYILWLKRVLVSRNLDTSHTTDALIQLKQMLAGLLPATDMEKVATIIQLAIEKFETHGNEQIDYTPALHPEHSSTKAYTSALIASNRLAAGDVISQAIDNGTPFTDVSVTIMQPAMYEIGRQWQFNRISVAQEHLATAISQSLLAKAYQCAEFKDSNNKNALFTCIENNHHALGLRMVSDAFEIEGWSVDYLGENTPTDSLIRMLDSNPVDLLGLSVSMSDQIVTLADTIDKIRTTLGSMCPPIAIGGLPLSTTPSLALNLKADAWFPDAKTAAEDAN